MTLRERMDTALKAAMKERDELRLSVIRMVRSAVKNREIEQKKEMQDEGITEVISSLVKQRRESVRLFRDGDREDLAAKEEKEIEILLGFLPRQLDRTEIEELVDSVIRSLGAQGAKDMGRVMKDLQPQLAGRADGRLVSEIVREKLS
jgi:uncharacterized protein YqeY